MKAATENNSVLLLGLDSLIAVILCHLPQTVQNRFRLRQSGSRALEPV